MRIVLLASRFFPHRGGLEVVVSELAQEMNSCGHNVHVVTNRYPRTLPEFEVLDNIPVTRYHFLYPRREYLRNHRFDLFFVGIILFPLTLLKLLCFFLKLKPQVVNLHYLGAPTLFVCILAHFFPFRFVISLHGGDVDGEPLKNRFNKWIFRTALFKADTITTCSQALADQVVEMVPEIKAKISVIRNGVSTSVFDSSMPYFHSSPYLFSAGQLVAHKGFDLLIDAFSQISDEYPSVHLLIAGVGDFQGKLFKLVEKHNLQGRIFFVGVKNRNQIASLMRGSIAIIIPSLREPFGIIALEAWASGNAIIASRVGGLPEALKGSDAFFILPGDCDSLKSALMAILKNPDKYKQTKPVPTNFSWPYICQCYLALYGSSS